MRNVNLLLYLNLAGEVFYIIVHRMKSQKVKEEHQERVRNDIAVAICHSTIISNLLKGSLQILNLKLSDVRILMDRIVHSSIMTVNAFSMEKLFELTLIATKYQYTTCQYPSDILLIAMNHLDTIRKSVTDSTAKTLSENLHNLLVDRFKDIDIRTMQSYRYLVLSYLADVKLKMTNLIRLGLQKTSGEFVKELPDKVKRPEVHQPGLIEVFKSPDEDETTSVPVCTSFACSTHSYCQCDEFDREEGLKGLLNGTSKKPLQVHESSSRGTEILTTRFKMDDPDSKTYPVLKTSLAMNGSRGIPLGLSIYDIPGNCEEGPVKSDESGADVNNKGKEGSEEKPTKERKAEDIQQDFMTNSDFYATKGLDLCSVLLGCEPSESKSDLEHSTASRLENFSVSASALGLESMLDNFPSLGFGKKMEEEESSRGLNPSAVNVINFDARGDSSGSKAKLVAIAQDFFDLDADQRLGESECENSLYSNVMDDLLGGLEIPED